MARIAAVAIEWTEIEKNLVLLVNASLGAVQTQGGSVIGLSGNRVARIAMEQAETIRARIKLINALVAPMLEGNPLRERWSTLEVDLQRKSRQRNKIVHGDWSHSSELPGELILQRDGRRERWPIDEFEGVQKGFRQLMMDIRSLTAEIAAAKVRGEITQPEDRMNSIAIAAIGRRP